MGKRHSKLRKVIPLVLGLAAGSAGAVSAQEAVDNSVFNTPEGDFVFVTDYMHETNRNEITDINALVKGGDSRKGVKPKIYALDPSVAIQSRIKFYNSARAKQFYSQEQRLDLIGRCQNFLAELKAKKIAPSKKSLEALSVALSDGTINPEELKDVENSVYAIVKEGYDNKVGNYAVFYLTELTSEPTISQFKAIAKAYHDLVEKSTKDLEQKAQTPVIEAPKQKKDYRSIYLQAQQTTNGDLDSHTTSLGARFNPFQKVDIGFGANLDIGFGLDKETDSYSALLSAGRTANGTMTDTGKFSIGGSLEAQFGPLLIGGGFDYKNWIQNVVEQILDSSGNVVKSNTNSIPNRQIFGKVYTGVELPIGDAMRLGMVAGYNMKDGGYFGFRVGLKVK